MTLYSTVALDWIRSQNKDWKQFVQNRVNSIRKLVAAEHWRHCPGTENPADIPSRGLDLSNTTRRQLWLHGPKLCHYDHYTENAHVNSSGMSQQNERSRQSSAQSVSQKHRMHSNAEL